jgi:hypothetical protein
VLVLALLVCVGCASPGEKSEWDEFWKDLRGDNLKMRADRDRPDDARSSP